MTKICPANPHPEATCPTFLAFLDQITCGRPELAEFLQRVAGLSLIGEAIIHALFFFYGGGGNGKGTLLRILGKVMGSYATVAATSTFVAQAQQAHKQELAVLKGARLVTAQEIGENQKWDKERLKELSGGDEITANKMHQNSITFQPEFTLIFSANNKPSFGKVDDGIRRRFYLVPFDFKLEKEDPDIEDRLFAERDGILRWMIEGALEVQRIGLSPPECVRGQTREYLSQQDTVGQWLEECTYRTGDWHIKRSSLWESWKDWCSQANVRWGERSAFYARLEECGLEQTVYNGDRVFMYLNIGHAPTAFDLSSYATPEQVEAHLAAFEAEPPPDWAAPSAAEAFAHASPPLSGRLGPPKHPPVAG
jgi:putative DNA primase/helicase